MTSKKEKLVARATDVFAGEDVDGVINYLFNWFSVDEIEEFIQYAEKEKGWDDEEDDED